MAFIQTSYYSYVRKGFVQFTAILPIENLPDRARPNLSNYSSKKFSTIYLLHGYSGNCMDWVLRTRLEEWATDHGYAVIMPSCNNSFYVDHEDTGIKYGSFIAQEIVEVTRKMFPLSEKREDTVIGGLSMGGYGAIRNGLLYNDVFGYIIALSSALIIDEIATMKEGQGNDIESYSYYFHTFGDLSGLIGSSSDPKTLAQKCVNRPKLFLACGTEDFLYPNNKDFHEYLSKINYSHAWFTAPGIHDYDFWNLSLLEAFRSFLPNKND
jgi:putative tributyrin esterase